VVPGQGAVLGDPLQVDPLVGGQAVTRCGQRLLGLPSGFDPPGQVGLFLGGEPGHHADLLQVVLDRVRDLRLAGIVHAPPPPPAFTERNRIMLSREARKTFSRAGPAAAVRPVPVE
jgi:hypothetical protein